jgi:hypothetical protein
MNIDSFSKKLWMVCDVENLESLRKMLKIFDLVGKWRKWILNGFSKKLWMVCDVLDLESWMQNVENLCFV